MRLGVSPAATSTPKGVFIQRFEALFPGAGALGCGLLHSPTVPPGLSVCECGATGSVSCCTACPIPHQLPSCRESSLPQLPISAPPAGLDECFFFISLVVGLPYSSIFCQFWLFFVFKLLLSFFRLCEEAQCVYLHLYLGRKPNFLIVLKINFKEAKLHSAEVIHLEF